MKSFALLVAMAVVAVGCNRPGSSQTQLPSLAPASVSPLATPAGSAEPTSSQTDEALRIDALARVLVRELNLRAQPSASSGSLGHLRLDEPAYVVAGPVQADGYVWYQLGPVRPVLDCADDSTLACGQWFGLAAAETPDGDRWLGPLNLACPTERTTASYLSLQPAERLACAGDDEWKLTAYIAEEGGRGCLPVWVTDPGWLFTACNFLFPQPVERELDEDTGLQVFVHPDLGICGSSMFDSGCPFAPYKGSWVEMTGHLDDPAASTCVAKLSPDFSNVSDLPPPPDPDQVVFACRLAFVVTAVRPTSAPST